MDNTVELIGIYGSDLTHAQSAWTSTERELDEEKLNRVPKLLKYLADNGHETPFEKSTLHFLVDSEIASHIHMLKHRIGVSINAECLTGDNIITFVDINGNTSPKLRMTINELYEKYNNGRPHQNTIKDTAYSQSRIKNRRIRVLNEDTGFFEYSHIKDIYYSGKKVVYEIKLANGKILKCSENHKIFTKNGWGTISNKLIRKGIKVACNGIKTCVKNKPWTYPEFFNGSEKYTRNEFASKNNMKSCTIKKWGYIFNVQFKKDVNKDFKKGHVPWNKNIKGYKLDISEEGLASKRKNIKRGKDCHFWRGGITSQRGLIGEWTRRNAKIVHEKYNFTCQNCGNSSDKLCAHHILPVVQYPSLAKDINNLITVCESCHFDIHKSIDNETTFANKVTNGDFKPFLYTKKIGDRTKRKLHVEYSEIVDVKEIGYEDTYDIEIEGNYKNFIANGMVVHNSARYKELNDDKYYVPIDWPQDMQEDYVDYMDKAFEKYHSVMTQLIDRGIDRKRAKESARFYLPYGNQLKCDISFNFRSFVHFQRLRNDEHAQLEIREIAQKMLELVINTGKFDHTINAFKLK